MTNPARRSGRVPSATPPVTEVLRFEIETLEQLRAAATASRRAGTPSGAGG
jgi:hypothetical protein